MRERAPLLLLLVIVVAACGDDSLPPQVPTTPTGPGAAAPGPVVRAPHAHLRDRMVTEQIEGRGVRDQRVLAALRRVPRHEFVAASPEFAYMDTPLPIGAGQTISQPYIVASMTEELALRPGDRVLEIGTGSGYQAAVLAEIVDDVSTIEIVPGLHERSTELLERLGYDGIRTRRADGWFGWPERAPFDRIIVTAASPQVPPALVDQLARGGRMVIPVGRPYAAQTLVLLVKRDDGTVATKNLYAVRFVPFTREPEPDEVPR